MRRFLFVVLINFSLSIFAQTYQRNSGETKELFAERLKPIRNSGIQGEVLEVSRWNSLVKPVFAFYDYSEPGIENGKKNGFNYTYVDGYIFVPVANSRYAKIFIDTYAEEGATAEIESVFFANVDKDLDKELGVLVSWDQSRHYGMSGKLYQVYFYDYPKFISKNIKLKPIEMKKFKMEFDGTNDAGEKSGAIFNTTSKIKAELKRLGF